MKSPAVFLAVLVCLGASTLAHAQYSASDTSNQTQTPAYAVNVVSRTTRAVKYEHRSGPTTIGFEGTQLMPGASGEAKIESQRGTMKIGLELSGLDKPTSFGQEYLTYVLWAISPEGRPVNLGEVLVGSNRRSKLDVTTDLQTFALIVTAEPYYAVRRPSDVVIAENAIRPGTVGTSEAVDAKYELIDRGGYIPTGYHFDPLVLNAKLPLEFFEARNAVRIAKSAGAEEYAAPSYQKSVDEMKQADDLAIMKHVDQKALISASREVVQTADDSREIAVKRMDADRIDADKDSAAAKLADSRADTREQMQARMSAEAATADANASKDAESVRLADSQARTREETQARMNAESATADANAGKDSANAKLADSQARTREETQGRLNAEAATADANADKDSANAKLADSQADTQDQMQARRNAEAATADANRGRVQADQATAEAQRGQQEALSNSDRDRAATATANQATSDAQQAQRNAEADSQQSRIAAANSDQQLQQAVQDREDLRAKLLQQFNLIFATRDTARGLIVNLSDVLFDSGKATLLPGAREKLAKISGIVLAYPDLRLAIEGNTDSVGTDASNQLLSEQRAESVRSYLAAENIPNSSMTSRGFGKTQPVASNDTAEGRQQNRRVELVVSGEVIGTTVGIVSENQPVTERPLR